MRAVLPIDLLVYLSSHPSLDLHEAFLTARFSGSGIDSADIATALGTLERMYVAAFV